MAKYELWVLKIMGAEYANMFVEDKIGIDRLIDLIIYYDNNCYIIEDIYKEFGIKVDFLVYKFNTENDRQNAHDILELLTGMLDYDDCKHRNVHAFNARCRNYIKSLITTEKQKLMDYKLENLKIFAESLNCSDESFVEKIYEWYDSTLGTNPLERFWLSEINIRDWINQHYSTTQT